MGGYDALAEGQVLLNKYRIGPKLGEGGMAVVYLATSLGAAGFERAVVLKVIKPHLARTPGMVDGFVREASLGAELDHPNIVQVLDLGDFQGMLYMVLEYVQGKDLAALTHKARRARRVLGPELVMSIGIDVCKALECSHTHVEADGTPQPIIHRDISPQNILISREGSVKLADFGMARALGTARQTAEGVVKGKLSYMSPEQSRGQEVDARSDLFSLGVVLWETLTGRRLFLAKNPVETVKRVRTCTVPPLTEVAPHVTPALADIIHTFLKAEPSERFQTATEARKAMQSYLRTARPLEANALADLVEVYFPIEQSVVQTALPELSFADEGDETDEAANSDLESQESTAEEEAPEEPDAKEAPATLLMYGEKAEELQRAFQEAQAAAKTRSRDAQDGLPTMAFDPGTTNQAADELATVADIPAPEIQRPAANPSAEAKKTPPKTVLVAPPAGAPAMTPRAGAPAVTPQGGLPAMSTPQAGMPATGTPMAGVNAVTPVKQTPARVVPQPGQQGHEEDDSGSQRTLIISLLIGIPLGALVGFLVFWLLTS